MKYSTRLSFIALLTLSLVGCGSTPAPVDPPPPVYDDLQAQNLTMNVYGTTNNVPRIVNPLDGETFEYTIANNSDAIRMEDGKFIAHRGNTITTVNVTSSLGRSTSFTVKVNSRRYVSTHETAETNEGWFNEVNISKVNNMTSEFANGMDISSMWVVYHNEQKFYDKNGNETALPWILKDSGINWVRLRLWHTPSETYIEDGQEKVFEYGGGYCTTENMIWVAKECKAAGLKVLLDFHYSDSWTAPGSQVVPKAWRNVTTSTEMANKIKEYTKETLLEFKNSGATPDMVAIGNETTTGMILNSPGAAQTAPTGGQVSYITNRGNLSSAVRGYWNNTSDKTSNSIYRSYVKAAADAIKEVDSKILTTIHIAKGFSATSLIIDYFRTFDDLSIDVLSMSAYPYYQMSNKSTMTNAFNQISQAFPNKKICIAETSYGFTYEEDANARNGFSLTGDEHPISAYPVSIQGQANLIKDQSEIVANLSNGFGVFYWEGAWTPTRLSGWSDSLSYASWANQGLFSYNGKALGSLEVYNKMLGK